MAAPADGMSGLLRNRGFVLFLGAAAISNGGNWMQLIAVQALLYGLTGSGAWLGLFTVTMMVPAMLLTPYAGVLADRLSRRRILLFTQSTQMMTSFGLWGLYTTGLVSPWSVVLVGFVNGIATGFQTAAWQSFMPSLVERPALPHAIRLNSVQFTAARLLGPVAGAAALALGGIGLAIAANGVSYAAVIVVLLVVRPRPVPPLARTVGVLTNLRDGVVYVWRRPSLRLAVQLAFFVSMAGQSLQHIASAIAEEIYGRGAQANAGLLVAFGFGAMTSSAAMLTFGRRWRSSFQILVAMGILTVANVLLASSTTFTVGQIAYFLVGLSQVQTAVSLNTVLQSSISDDFRGRVMSLYLLGILGGIPAGSQILGVIGDVAGFRIAMALNAGAVAVLVGWLSMGARWRMMDGDEVPASSGVDEHEAATRRR